MLQFLSKWLESVKGTQIQLLSFTQTFHFICTKWVLFSHGFH